MPFPNPIKIDRPLYKFNFTSSTITTVPGSRAVRNSDTDLLCVHLVVAILDYFQAAAMKYYSLAAEKSPRDAAEAEQVEEAKAYIKKHGK